LRLRFAPKETGEPAAWQQAYVPSEERVQVREIDLSETSAGEGQAAIAAYAEEAQSGLNLSHGPMLRGMLFCFADKAPSQLLLVIHHLVVDGVSWRILLDDLSTAYRQLTHDEPVQLPAKTKSFKDWAIHLQHYADSESLIAEASYWLHRPATLDSLPTDFTSQPEANTVTSSACVRLELDRQNTSALLHEVSDAYRTQIDDILLTALVQACARWSGSRALLLNLEGHGREELFSDLDLSRTVGWFTAIFPVRLVLEGQGPGEELKAIKEQLRSVPKKGVGYGVLRYLSPNAAVREQLASQPQPQVSFNYLGSVDGLATDPILSVASETPGSEEGPAGRRIHLLDVIAQVKDGCLQLEIIYSAAVHRRATIETLARNILASLESLLSHCLSQDAGGFTPSDFPEAGLSQEELDRLVADLG